MPSRRRGHGRHLFGAARPASSAAPQPAPEPVYLNHAGTSWPKAPPVASAIASAGAAPPFANNDAYAGHASTIRRFLEAGSRSPAVDAADASRVLITPSCTAALSAAVAAASVGPGRDIGSSSAGHGGWGPGDVIVTSELEHHAMAAPLVHAARARGARIVTLPYDRNVPRAIDLDHLERVLSSNAGRVKLVALSHAANVTGDVLVRHDQMREWADLCRTHGALTLLDGAQTCGNVPVAPAQWGVDMFTLAGHKGPLGPLGVGALYIGADAIESGCIAAPSSSSDGMLEAASAAGNGRSGHTQAGVSPLQRAIDHITHDGMTSSPGWALSGPTFCDVGSVNMPAIAGLAAGLRWRMGLGDSPGEGPESSGTEPQHSQLHGLKLARRFAECVAVLDGVTVHGSLGAELQRGAPALAAAGSNDAASATNAAHVDSPTWVRVATVALSVSGMSPEAAAARMRETHGVVVGGGNHCSPWAHLALGTAADGGCLRVSFGPFSADEHVDTAVAAVAALQG